jgi:drug/metabolite transporter (DMT)-like permease
MAKTSLATTAVIEASSPAITLAIAVALLGESISAASFAGCLVILFAVIAVSLPAGKASASTKACPT